MCYIPRVILCARRVMWLLALHMWLRQGAKNFIIIQTVKSRSVFIVSFMIDSSCIAYSFVSWSVGISRLSHLCSLALKATPIFNHLNHMFSLVNVEFLMRDFLKTSYMDHIIAHSTLSSLEQKLLSSFWSPFVASFHDHDHMYAKWRFWPIRVRGWGQFCTAILVQLKFKHS